MAPAHMTHPVDLVGKKLSSVHDLADTLGLGFGELHHAPTRRSPNRMVGEFALQIQCTWKYSGEAGLHARATQDPALVVAATHLSGDGLMRVVFDDGTELAVYADASSDEEQWRLFKPGDPESHVVFGGGRVVPA